MAIVTLSGNVDTLASGKSWLVEIDFNEAQPNLIQEENDTAFTTGDGNWVFNNDALWDSSGAILINGNSTPGNYMRLSTDSVNRRIYPLERGKRYKVSMRIKASSEPIELRLGLWELYQHQYYFSVLGDGNWVTLQKEFIYSDPTGFHDLVCFFDTFWDMNNEVLIDWVKLECLDVVPIENSTFAVVEFGAWTIGSEDLKPSYVDGFKTSLVIRPLGGGMATNYRAVLSDWMEALVNNVGRVRFWDVTDDEPVLVWRGKVDNKSISIDLVDNTLSMDVVDFVIANSDIPCNTNPFAWDIQNMGAPLNAYRTLQELFLTYSNYMSPWILADTFYSSVVTDSTIRGWDIANRFVNLQGWNNSGTIVKLAIYAYRYFGNYDSPYAATLGELMNDISYAFQWKITPWLYGQLLVTQVFNTGGDVVAISDAAITSVEQGILDFDTRGAQINKIGTMTTSYPTPFVNFNEPTYVPSKEACVDGAGQLRKNVESNNLMFLSDWVVNTDPNTMVADLLSQSVSGVVITQSYMVNNTTYYKPTRWHAVYYDNGVETSVGWVTFEEMHKALIYLGYMKPRKYIKLSVTGTIFDPLKQYQVSWDSGYYKIQSQTINWVDNETELYLVEV